MLASVQKETARSTREGRPEIRTITGDVTAMHRGKYKQPGGGQKIVLAKHTGNVFLRRLRQTQPLKCSHPGQELHALIKRHEDRLDSESGDWVL